MASNRERAKEIDDLLKTVEPRFRKAFETGIRSLRDSFSLAEIERALNSGDLAQAANLINEGIVASAFIQFNREIQNAVQAGGDIASRWARADKIVFDLSVTESNTARFISSYQADKIREITAQTQMNIGEIVRGGVNAGRNPRDIARTVRDSIGLTAKQEAAVENFERLLRENKREALNRALRDKRFDRSILSAINNQRDISEDLIQKMKQRYRERFIHKRSQYIARTEAIRLVSTGNQHFWEQAVSNEVVEEKRLKRRWLPTQDGRTREHHMMIPGLNKDGVGLKEPFRTPYGPLMYPGDPSGSAANVINCFHPDTLILKRGLRYMIARRYKGDIVKIVLSNGVDLSVTPNHPILTEKGWVAAGELKESDNLVYGDFCDFSDRANPNVANIYASAQSLYGFFKVAGFVNGPGASRVDLHGEVVVGKVKEDIEIISLPSHLVGAFNAPVFKSLDKVKLKHSGLSEGFLLSKRLLKPPFIGLFSRSVGFLRGGNVFFSLLRSHSRHFNFIGFASGARSNFHIFKALINKASAFSDNFSNFFTGFKIITIKLFDRFMVLLPSQKVCFADVSVSDRKAFPVASGLKSKVKKAVFNKFVTPAYMFSYFSSGLSKIIKPFNFFKVGRSFFRPVGVSKISRFHYDGPVYNFETNNGIIIANNIVTHNCRCAVITRITAD